MAYQGDYWEPRRYPRQGHGQQRPHNRTWQPQQYDPGAHYQRLRYQHPLQPLGPSWQAAPAPVQPSYTSLPLLLQPGPGPRRRPRRQSRPAQRKVRTGFIGLAAALARASAAMTRYKASQGR